MHKPKTKEKLVLPQRAGPHPNPNPTQAPQVPLLPWLAQETGDTALGMREGRWQWVGGWAAASHYTWEAAPRSHPVFWKFPP